MESSYPEQDPLNKLYSMISTILQKRRDRITNLSCELLDLLLKSMSFEKTTNIVDDPIHGLSFKGYPNSDFIYQLSWIFHQWSIKKSFPVGFAKMEGFQETTNQVIEELNGYTTSISKLFQDISITLYNYQHQLAQSFIDEQEEALLEEAEQILNTLKTRGILICLGFRKTFLSSENMFPLKDSLIVQFTQPNVVLSEEEKKTKKGFSILTVGGKAFTKHAIRSSEGFWGKSTGTEAHKNQCALNVLHKILNNCTWMNIHLLPHQECVLECRVQEGYGIRWTINGAFRGFLEPMMEGGHEKKWRH